MYVCVHTYLYIVFNNIDLIFVHSPRNFADHQKFVKFLLSTFCAELATLEKRLTVYVCVFVPLDVACSVRMRNVSQLKRNAELPSCRPLRLSGQTRLLGKCDSVCDCGCLCWYYCYCCDCGCGCCWLCCVELVELHLSPLGNRSWRMLRFDWTPTSRGLAQRELLCASKSSDAAATSAQQLVKVKVGRSADKRQTNNRDANQWERERAQCCVGALLLLLLQCQVARPSIGRQTMTTMATTSTYRWVHWHSKLCTRRRRRLQLLSYKQCARETRRKREK